MAHMGFGAFGTDFGTTSFVIRKTNLEKYFSRFLSLREEHNLQNKEKLFLSKKYSFILCTREFIKIAGYPIAYWTNQSIRNIFNNCEQLGKQIDCKDGLTSGNNDKFIKFWFEPSFAEINFAPSPSFLIFFE